ncbi:response regulator [Ectothiorhodospiraceae bacterium BW-2]|nr:response regulator [Ectothiorhodospiraceae bacterium BW-2]
MARERRSPSLYLNLAMTIIATVVAIMVLYSVYHYANTKQAVVASMKRSSSMSIALLQNNLAPLIESYAVNEYQNLIFNELEHNLDYLAVVVEDLNMGQIMGQESAYVSGKIRLSESEITSYKPQYHPLLASSFYSDSGDIVAESGEILGQITLYMSDELLKRQLRQTLLQHLVVALGLSLILILALFISIRNFVLRPLSIIVTSLGDCDESGIPQHSIPLQKYREIAILAKAINAMLQTIRLSKQQLEENHQQLKDERDRFQLAIEGTQDGLWDWDPKSDKVFFSRQWKQMLGYAEEEIGDSITEWSGRVHPEDKAATMQAVQAHLKGESMVYENRHRLRCRDGSWRWILDRGKALIDEEGKVVRMVGFHTDITRDIEHQQAAESANRAKSLFLATMSHEIRTPMTGILGMAELLLETELSPQQRQQVVLITESGRNLLAIINDILDFSKISSGKMALESHPFNLLELVRQTLELFQFSTAAKGIALDLVHNFEPQGGYKPFVRGDSTRLRQVLVNLIGNAIKFTESGSVRLELQVLSCLNERLRLAFAVEDSGIGISTEQQQRLFEPFMQANQDTARKYGGSGLGLSISRSLVELMGGEISLNSVVGVGTTFSFIITLSSCDSQEVESELPREASQIEPMQGRLLVVDDISTNLIVAEGILSTLGLTVVTAANGEEAIALWKTGQFDLLLLDCLMPIMDGYTTSRKIRELEQAPNHIPILALTANASSEDYQRCIEAGMDGVITKPFRKNDLYLALRRYLSGREPTATAVVATVEPDSTERQPALDTELDLTRLQQLVHDVGKMAPRVLSISIEGLEGLLQQLAQTAQTMDRSSLIRQFHSMKSTAAMVGAVRLSETARQLELTLKELPAEESFNLQPSLQQLQQQFQQVVGEIRQWIDQLTG